MSLTADQLWNRAATRYDSITGPTKNGRSTEVGEFSESNDFYTAAAIHTGLTKGDVAAYIVNLKAQIARSIASDPRTAGPILEGTLNCAFIYGWILRDEQQKSKEGGGRHLRPRTNLRRHRRAAARRRPQVLSVLRNRSGCPWGGCVVPGFDDFSPAMQRALVRQQDVINAIAGAPAGTFDVVRATAPTSSAYAIHIGEPTAHLDELAKTIALGVRRLSKTNPSSAAAGALLDGIALGYFLAQEQEASK